MAIGITTLGSRTFLSGGISGIDTSALIEAAYNQRKAEADKIDLRITANGTRVAAYSALQTLGQNVQSTLTNLRRDYSILATPHSLFDNRTGTLASSSTTSPTSLVNVTIDPGTDLGSYEIEVIQKAQAHRVGGNDSTTDRSADLLYTGTFDIGLVGGGVSTINVTSDMSLDELASAINAVKDTTGVSASILKTSDNGYQLILSGDETNKDIEVTNITGNDVLQGLGVLNNTGGFVDEIQQAQGAIIELDGVEVTRDSNDFSDLIDGVGLTVKNSEPGTIIQLEIQNDTATAADGITAFVDAYNELRDFIASNQEVSSEGELGENAVLFGDFLLKNMNTEIQALLTAGSYGVAGSGFTTLRDIGITMGADGKLSVDTVKLDDALTDNFESVRSIFETSVESDNTNFRMMANTSRVATMSFAMDITYSGGAITGVSVGGNSNLFDIDGTLIKGKAGTIYEGMSFAYIGTTSTTVNFDMNQGLGDLFHNTLDVSTNTVGGSLQTEKIRLDEMNTELQARADRVLERAADFRDRLITKYAYYEAQMSAAQTVLAQLQAILNSNNKDN